MLASLSLSELCNAEAAAQAALGRLSEARVRAQLAEEQREAEECVVCKERARVVCFAPCGHLICCDACASAVDACPFCRRPVASRLRAFS